MSPFPPRGFERHDAVGHRHALSVLRRAQIFEARAQRINKIDVDQ
jgi:hypothetical protein